MAPKLAVSAIQCWTATEEYYSNDMEQITIYTVFKYW
jgi:hypothetical protein